jgi:hypothetical protein
MRSRAGRSDFRPHLNKLQTIRFLQMPLETWALVLVLISIIVLGALALGTCWDSLGAPSDQATTLRQDRLISDFEC